MSTRYHGIDYLRVILVCGVAFAHAAMLNGQYADWVPIFGNGILRSLVPTFALISGYGAYQTVKRGRLKSWTIGLMWLYLLWCVIYAPLWLRDIGSVQDFIRQMILGPMHLWYIAALLQSVALMLLLFLLIPDHKRASRLVMTSALVVALLGSFLQYGFFLGFIDLHLEMIRYSAFFIYPFVAMGYLLAEWMGDSGREMLPAAGWLWLAVIVMSVLRLLEAGYFLGLPGAHDWDPPEFPLLAYGYPLIVMLAFMRLNLPQPRVDLVTLSVMIYLAHLGVILAMMHFGLKSLWPNFAASVLIPTAVVLATPGFPWLGARHKNRDAARHPRDSASRMNSR